MKINLATQGLSSCNPSYYTNVFTCWHYHVARLLSIVRCVYCQSDVLRVQHSEIEVGDAKAILHPLAAKFGGQGMVCLVDLVMGLG